MPCRQPDAQWVPQSLSSRSAGGVFRAEYAPPQTCSAERLTVKVVRFSLCSDRTERPDAMSFPCNVACLGQGISAVTPG